MRIIAGRFRGRALAALGKGDPAAHLRPTSDRVRESLFSMLGGGRLPVDLDGARVLDLFAGTGTLGLEALSRGAVNMTFVENGRTALNLLARNIELCGAGPECSVLRRDATRLGDNPVAPFDLVFLDPPYGKRLGEKALVAAMAGGWLAPKALVVWEEGGDVVLPRGLNLLDERRFGDTWIRFAQAQA